jgi:hypothetical protein
MDTVQTKFDPLVNGFKFVNHFEFPDLFKINLPFVRAIPIATNEIVYGLCGGMCFTALDYLYAGKPVPATTNVDDINYSLFINLWKRQIDSLGKDALQKIFSFMILDDADSTKKVVLEEIPKVRRLVDQGQPAVLVLIRVKGLVDPTHNHQVVVTSYAYNPDTDELTLNLYEPNHPGMASTLNVKGLKTPVSAQITQSTGEGLRGFFVIDYSSKPPA